MKSVIRSVFVLVVLVVFQAVAWGQDVAGTQAKASAAGWIQSGVLKPNFALFGAGLRSGSTLTGVSGICRAVGQYNYLCAETKFAGSTTANTVELKQVVLARSGFVVAINGNIGVATGADGGLGKAVSAGGAGLYEVSRIRSLHLPPGYWVGVSGAWDKRDVTEFVNQVRASGTAQGVLGALRPFGSRGVYTFFAGKSW
jgi:hypothetical protein